jgi:hypothetical protein
MQVSTFVNHAHLLLVVTNDLNEVSHDVREEGHPSKHNNNSYDPLIVADRIVVTVPNRAQGGERVVATDDQLVSLVLLVQAVFLNEGVRFGVFRVLVVDGAEHEPNATDEVRDDDSNDD